jgi:hypothetical protein
VRPLKSARIKNETPAKAPKRTILIIAVLSLLFISPVISKGDSISENFNTHTSMLNATNIGTFTVTGGAVDVVGGVSFGGA